MDDALVQEDGIDLIVEELDRCWEVTQDQDKASKIEKALFETQRDVKMETTFMSYVACALVLECPLPCLSLLLSQVPLPPLPDSCHGA